MLGSFGVGKTSLVSQYVHSIFSEEYLSTVGVKIDRKTLRVDNETELGLVIWDIAGDDRFERLHNSYLLGLSGFFLVIDGCRPETLKVARSILVTMSKMLTGVPFVCLINKQDLEADWRVTDDDIAGLQAQGWTVMKTSAKYGDTVEAAFDALGKMLVDSPDRMIA